MFCSVSVAFTVIVYAPGATSIPLSALPSQTVEQ